MPTSKPLHIAFVWHMHQPYYRSALTGAFEMPWARLHALKDYLNMVETLSTYPELHQTFNLVPSLVEQLEDYAAGDFVDTYWKHTLKPACELDTAERAFILERMCEHPDHPRTRAHPRYLELAKKREAHASHGWEACAGTFTADELRDLQIWFNLAWFDPEMLEGDPLRGLAAQGRGFSEDDKNLIAEVQADILARTLPAYKAAAGAGQIELSTSPYFHAILPLLINSDSTRIAVCDAILPQRRFAHSEDAAEQVRAAVAKHQEVFGDTPEGMWCSEQAVGEDVIPLLADAGLSWSISDETVLSRSLSGAAGPNPRELTPESLYRAYRLGRDEKEIAMVFRDHTLSDLIGFSYRSWDSRAAAADLIRRLLDLTVSLRPTRAAKAAGASAPLVTIALDGENAWEYYPRDGRDFLRYLYEGLCSEPSLRCVTVSEHLSQAASLPPLDWLHTGSWIGGDLRTWSGDAAHNTAWNLLHGARDVAARHRKTVCAPTGAATLDVSQVEGAWRHVMIAEGSDWFWWFGDHHHTELDHVWDLQFRLHLQEVYRLLGEEVPAELFMPVLEPTQSGRPMSPQGPVSPTIDGLITDPTEWDQAGFLVPDLPSTMQRAENIEIDMVRFGWKGDSFCLLIVPRVPGSLQDLEVEIRFVGPSDEPGPAYQLTLEENGQVEVSCTQHAKAAEAAWNEVLEAKLPVDLNANRPTGDAGLILRIGREGVAEHVFHSTGLDSLGWEEG